MAYVTFIAENTEPEEVEEAEEQVMDEKDKELLDQLKKSGAKDPEALAAWIGRKKYGEFYKKLVADGKKS